MLMEVSVGQDVEFHLESSRNDMNNDFEKGKEETSLLASSLATESCDHPLPEQEVSKILGCTRD